MALRKDKKKVIGDDMTDTQVAIYVDYQPIDNGRDEKDFLILQNAYRGLRAHDFQRFFTQFVSNGGQVSATDKYGKTLADYIRKHKYGTPYLAILTA